MLTADSERPFDQATRDASLSVFSGAARVYLPGVDRADPMPWRHRYVRASLLTNRHRTAAARIAQLVLPCMVAQRPPALYRTHVKQLLDQSLGEQTDWEALAVELDETLSLLQLEVEDLREEKDLALMEALDSERGAADALQKLDAHRQQLRVRGEVPELVELEIDETIEVDSCAQAVALAASLKHLVLHPNAPRDISRMDESSNAELWGQRIWSHLQSLDAYAEARGPGFKTWCETSGHPRAISGKFILMTEARRSARMNDYVTTVICRSTRPSLLRGSWRCLRTSSRSRAAACRFLASTFMTTPRGRPARCISASSVLMT
jgi:FtsZ-binding cell division protein ZapB